MVHVCTHTPNTEGFWGLTCGPLGQRYARRGGFTPLALSTPLALPSVYFNKELLSSIAPCLFSLPEA